MTGPVLVGQFWGLDSDRILKLVLREIILPKEIQMPPGGRRTVGHRLQQFLPFGRIIDLGEFLRQIQVIPADDVILDEPCRLRPSPVRSLPSEARTWSA